MEQFDRRHRAVLPYRHSDSCVTIGLLVTDKRFRERRRVVAIGRSEGMVKVAYFVFRCSRENAAPEEFRNIGRKASPTIDLQR